MSEHTENPPITLVIGGHGKTGSRVAERLAAAGRATRVASRSTTPRFEWHDESTWTAALDGTSSAYVTFQPDLAVPGSIEIITAFGVAARDQGLEHLVLLSGRGEEQAQACEAALADSGVATTIVRCAFFAQNFSEHFLVDAVQDGVVALPAGDVTEPIVDVDDVAEVAAAALLGQVPSGRVYELTGPRLMTFQDMADDLGKAIGRTITYLPVSTEEYVVAAKEAGVPGDEAEMLGELFADIFDGHNSSLASGVEEALGRPARDFADFAVQAAPTGVWTVS
ncbi:MAG: NmrA family NAD(P)-binding protein [Nocardioides sp.]|nr:NmrA family NAD(P)-binding protein [Nocardioides sp.]